jgi:hypothetical protein
LSSFDWQNDILRWRRANGRTDDGEVKPAPPPTPAEDDNLYERIRHLEAHLKAARRDLDLANASRAMLAGRLLYALRNPPPTPPPPPPAPPRVIVPKPKKPKPESLQMREMLGLREYFVPHLKCLHCGADIPGEWFLEGKPRERLCDSCRRKSDHDDYGLVAKKPFKATPMRYVDGEEARMFRAHTQFSLAQWDNAIRAMEDG